MAEQLAQEAIGAALAQEAELNEPALVRELVSRVPEGSTLVVSSSMPARDVEWWPRPRKGLRFIANRGVNGIDGVVSTALGVALAGSRRTVALVGDLAFAYDVTALLPARELGAGLDIVVVDNDGGGIFNFLPQAAQQPPERFERLWATPHRVDLVQVARCFGADAAEVDDLQALAQRLGDEHRGGVRAHVAKIRRQGNVAVHQRLHAAVAEALEALA